MSARPQRSRVMAWLDRLFGSGPVEPQLELFRAEVAKAQANAPVVAEMIRRMDRHDLPRAEERSGEEARPW